MLNLVCQSFGVILMDAFVDKPKCTGCQHCKDVCPVGVFEMHSRKDMVKSNAYNAPAEMKWDGQLHADIHAKWKDVQDGHKHYADENDGTSGGLSVGVQGS